MSNSIYIFDPNLNLIGYLSNNGAFPNAPFFDDIYISELSTGAESYEFSSLSNSITSELLNEGNYVVFKYRNKYKMFQIMDIDDEHGESKIITCYCEMAGLELLTDYAEPFNLEGNVELFFNTVLQDSNWNVGNIDETLLTNIQQVKNEKHENVYKVIQDNLVTYGNIELDFRVEFSGNAVTGFFIDVYANGNRGQKKYKRFEYGENVSEVKRNRNMYDFASAMIGRGADGITFKDIEWVKAIGDPADKPKGQDFIVDLDANDRFNKRGKYIKSIYEGQETNAQDLLIATWNKLQEVKEPKFDYEVDLALTDTEYEDIEIGDTNYVIDNDYNPPILLECRVGKLEISLTGSNKNKCTLSNYKEIKSKISSLSPEAILKNVKEFIAELEVGMLTKTTIEQLKMYMQQMGVEKSEIDRIVAEFNKMMEDKLEEEQRNKVEGEYIDILINDSAKKYICGVVKSVKFRLPSSVPSGFNTLLEFTTEKDTAPTKFYQSVDCWCNGVDCWNGGLVPKAATTYTIILKPNTNIDITQKYIGTVTKVHHGGSYSIYENQTKYVEKVREVMQSYYHVRDKFIYDTVTPFSFKDPTTSSNRAKWITNGKFHIDCSTFVHFVIRGIAYEESIYARPTKSPYFLSGKYDYSFVLDATISDRDRYASDMARACIEQGWQLDIDMTNQSNWRNLQTGDIIFWAKRYGEETVEFKERYMRVGHVAIVSSVLDDGDVTTYESTSGNNNSILNRRLSANFPEKILFVARPRR